METNANNTANNNAPQKIEFKPNHEDYQQLVKSSGNVAVARIIGTTIIGSVGIWSLTKIAGYLCNRSKKNKKDDCDK